MNERITTAEGAEPPVTQRVLRGMGWTYGGLASNVALQLVYTSVISRILAPSVFGLVALANLLLRLILHFARFGITSAVIQKPELDEEDIRVAHTASVLIGFAAFGFFWVAAPYLARLVSEPDATDVARALSVAFLINGLALTATGLVRRRGRFASYALVEVLSYALGYPITGITLALMGAGVWSLVAAALVQSITLAVGTLILGRHSLTPLFDRARLRSILSFGGRVSVTGFLEFVSFNLDTISVGKFLGTTALGFYSRASLLIAMPVEQFATGITRVLLPTFSRLQEEKERLANAYVFGLATFTGVIFPACAFVAIAAETVVTAVLGDGWGPSARVLPIIAVAVALDMVVHLPAVLAEAIGRLNEKLIIQVMHLAIVLTGIAVVVAMGPTLINLAAIWLVGQAIRHVAYLLFMDRAIAAARSLVFRGYAEGLALAGIVGIATWLGLQAGGSLHPIVRLATVGTLAGLVWITVLVAYPRSLLHREAARRGLLRWLPGRSH